MGVSQTIWQGRGQIVKFWMQEVFISIFASFNNELNTFIHLWSLHRKFEYSSRGIKASPVICQVCKAWDSHSPYEV